MGKKTIVGQIKKNKKKGIRPHKFFCIQILPSVMYADLLFLVFKGPFFYNMISQLILFSTKLANSFTIIDIVDCEFDLDNKWLSD